ncbi:transcriptional regulator of acetoin/glycerol metabolism [Burkholderia sp. OAS925]|jgi:transcriptional regulator of acetoin/glycerol metabolism|uniref:sigma-54-dependent Fis family transcriptional regulator n=1 Tax=Paraburkholderia TaxID=1822464 RepID=UPI0006B3EFCC|nr:helix-turn-helix domain-containing protein [Paraburkholderia graminis]ALE57288.1 Fis family transcriptional regulator [Burkholderia sp. HB1]MDR6475558.1 transcriptional regulator of acetoin/glycerol metabolism [Paraburkholderia graminis]
MPYVPSTRHIDRICNVIEGRTQRPGADGKRLASSYRRSLEQYHLDPGATAGPRILTVPELRDVQHREESFLRASGQCLSRLHEMVREADYCVMLTDAKGVTIDYRVDKDRRHDFKRAGLYLGSCWSESEEGTCGVATVLLDAEPITVHRSDHFRAAFTTLTCSASPIFGLHGELLGVLDASAVRSPDDRESQRLVNHIVRQSALLIEDAYFLNAATDCWVLLAHRNRHYVEAQPEILIAIDARGHAVAANRRARECLPALNQLPRHVSEIFDVPPERLFDAKTSRGLVSLRLNDTGSPLYARVRAPAAARISRRTHAASPEASTNNANTAPHDMPLMSESEALERRRIVDAMNDAKWRTDLAAQALGISRATLYRRIAKLHILPPHKC